MQRVDWSWRPDWKTRDALRRGEQKFRRTLRELIESGRLTAPHGAIDSAARHEVRAYVQRERLRQRLGYTIDQPLITMAGR